MNSGSEKKLSMDELLEKNRPAQMVQTTQPPAQDLTPPLEVHPTKAEWEDLQSALYTGVPHRETDWLSEEDQRTAGAVPEPDADGGTAESGEASGADERTGWEAERKAFFSTRHQAAQTESAGHSMDQSAVGTGGPGADWAGAVGGVVQLGHALERGQGPAPVKDATTTHYHADSKALRKERQKKIAQGHAEDDHEEEQTWQQTM